MPVSILAAPNLKPQPVPHHTTADSHPLGFVEYISHLDPRSTLVVSSDVPKDTFVPLRGGLVDLVLQAYCKHHNLVIRPDDVWIAIVSQFARFAEANAEVLRSRFVNFEGKKNLTFVSSGTMQTPGLMAEAVDWFEAEIHKNVKDQDLRRWIIPHFSTTTQTDRIVGGMLLMTTVKSYFDYEMELLCGIPRITLEGERQDWEEVLLRASRLASYGSDCVAWQDMLVPILGHFVAAFDGTVDLEFWNRICDIHILGSGSDYLSGWITTFTVFDKHGKWQANCKTIPDHIDEPTTPWCVLSEENVTTGCPTCPIKVNDNGDEYNATLVVGLIGGTIEPDQTTLRPLVGWAVCRDPAKPSDPSEE
ncbi:hypothetical protein HDU93_007409 [Gonapodya sp. JEL0774]|nr:hypothetical protein HDU93_007409 [Gonapodya sp. JEL0774]